MKKYLKTTKILLPQGNEVKSVIYEHENKFYIKDNKPNTSSFYQIRYDNILYSEVKEINGNWFMN